MMMRNVYLHGALRERYGPVHRFDIETAQEAGRALAANFRGFREAVRRGKYRVVRGDYDTGLELGNEDVTMRLGRETDLHIEPYVSGSKQSGGIVKIVLGVVLVAAAFVTAGGSLAALPSTAVIPGVIGATDVALLGGALVLAGTAQLLAPSPKINQDTKEKPDARSSFIFTGPVNRTEEGNCVPLGYGRMRVGSVLVSGSLSIEKLL